MSVVVCNNNSLSAITSIPASISGGALNLISTQTISSASTATITSGLDSTYKEYIIKFINVHPAQNQVSFEFNGSIDSGSNYNVTKTTTAFNSYLQEDGAEGSLGYAAYADVAQGTGDHRLVHDVGSDNDECFNGVIHLFDPSNTTFIKHFIARFIFTHHLPAALEFYGGGYFNTTSAINALRFQFTSNNIESGTIKLYGVS